MKKVLALGAMAVVLGLGFEGAPAMAISAADAEASAASGVAGASLTFSADVASSADAASLVAAAVARAEEAIAKTATVTVNAKEVAAMREYLQGWVAQARALDLTRLTEGQLKELIAALDEGARGLRMTAGVDRKVAGSSSSVVASSTVSGSVAEPRTLKEASKVVEAMEATEVAKVAEASDVKTAVAKVSTAQASATKAEVAAVVESKVASALEVAEMNALATLATAQVKKPTTVVTLAVAEDAEVDVPKTGADDEAEQTSTAVRGMGLVLGGAVVLAAVGAVLIVKRMKRGL